MAGSVEVSGLAVGTGRIGHSGRWFEDLCRVGDESRSAAYLAGRNLGAVASS